MKSPVTIDNYDSFANSVELAAQRALVEERERERRRSDKLYK